MKKRLTLRDLYTSFSNLIWETRCIEGSLLAVADRSKIDHGTLTKWLHRRTKHPEEALLRKLVRAYPDLGDVQGVIELIQRDAMREIMGQPIPAPDLSGVRPGPIPKALPPKRRRASRALGWAVAAVGITAAGWVPAEGRTPPNWAFSLESLLSEVLKLLRRLGILPDTGITPVIGTYPDTGFRVFPDSSFPDLRTASAA